MWEIALVRDAVCKTFGCFKKSILHLPYLPHARADRVFETGNALPLEVFLDSILGFTEVMLTDPHSDFIFQKEYHKVIEVSIKPQHQCFIETVRGIQSGIVLVSPDKGATKKIYKLQQALDVRTIAAFVLEADKKRDVSTGRIIETTLPVDFDYVGKTFYIVDDLCDGGGTFIPLAQKLKDLGAKEVNLYVTHMIGTKGLDLFKGIIDIIYCYQVVGKYLTMKDVQHYSNSTKHLGD
jgi:ribose-phosphate pyrophosphokinase